MGLFEVRRREGADHRPWRKRDALPGLGFGGCLPLGLCRGQLGSRGDQGLLQTGDACLHRLQRFIDRSNPHGIGRRVPHAPLLDVSEERTEAIEVAHGERVVLVIVTLCTTERDPQEDGAGVANAVGRVFRQVLLGLGPALAGRLQQHVETRGDLLSCVGLRQQVPGQLLGHEPVEPEVVVERLDHVVPVGSDLAGLVGVVPVAVGVTDDIQPVDRHPFAVMR